MTIEFLSYQALDKYWIGVEFSSWTFYLLLILLEISDGKWSVYNILFNLDHI